MSKGARPIRAQGLPLAGSVALALLVSLALAPIASAQADPVTATVTAEAPTSPIGPGKQTTVPITIENNGQLDATAEVAITVDGQGWSASLSSTTVDVPAGGEATIDATLQAPSDRNNSASNATFEVSATLTGPLGQSTASDSATFSAQLTPPAPPPPEPFPWALVLGGAGVGLLAALALIGGVLYKRETGLEISLPDEHAIPPGQEGYVPVVIRNTRDQARKGIIEIDRAPTGWAVGLNRSWLLVDPQGVKRLWLVVKPPENANGLTEPVELSVRTEEARWHEDEARVAIHADSNADAPESPGRFLTAPIGTPAPGAPPLPEDDPDQVIQEARRQARDANEAPD